MLKTVSAIAAAALIAAAIAVMPGFATQVDASVPVAAEKADRLDHPPDRHGLLAEGLALFRERLPA